MNQLTDKLILLILCFALYFQHASGAYLVVPVIAAVFVSALNSFRENGLLRLCSFSLYAAGCLFAPPLFFFLPLICYDLFRLKGQWAAAFSLFPLLLALRGYSAVTCAVTALLIPLSYFMKKRSASLGEMRSRYTGLRDSTKEFSLRLESRNRELLERQDYEITTATLSMVFLLFGHGSG